MKTGHAVLLLVALALLFGREYFTAFTRVQYEETPDTFWSLSSDHQYWVGLNGERVWVNHDERGGIHPPPPVPSAWQITFAPIALMP